MNSLSNILWVLSTSITVGVIYYLDGLPGFTGVLKTRKMQHYDKIVKKMYGGFRLRSSTENEKDATLVMNYQKCHGRESNLGLQKL